MEADRVMIWLNFLKVISEDSRLNVWHLCLLYAIFQLAGRQQEHRIVHVSRSTLMSLSHINTIPTYHKYFKQIQEFGYINYTPSYHPGYRSVVEVLFCN